MAGVVGIEPTSKVLETFVLPLNYTPKSILRQMYFIIKIGVFQILTKKKLTIPG